MRKPSYAMDGAATLEAKVFATGSRKAILEAVGTDPAQVAKALSEHKLIPAGERLRVRERTAKALKALASRAIPNATNIQLDVGGRRIRCATLQ